jgi:hypothetical protein
MKLSSKFAALALSAGLFAALAPSTAEARPGAGAALAPLSAAAPAGVVEQTQYRGRRGYRGRDYRGRGYYGDRRSYRRDRRRSRNRAIGLGIGAAVVGAAIASSAARSDRGAMQRCADTYRSFDWNSGTYTTYGGETVVCPYLR